LHHSCKREPLARLKTPRKKEQSILSLVFEWFHVPRASLEHTENGEKEHKNDERNDLLHYRCCLDGQGVLDSSGLMNFGTNGGE
jgi:hypothetical protein